MTAAHKFGSLTLVSSLAVLIGIGCASTPQASEPAPATSTAAASSSVSAPALTDAQIAAIVVTANQIDIDNGKLAESKSTNPEVQKFAQRMREDHTSVNEAATELVTRLGVTPEHTDTSRGLKQGADQTRQKMGTLEGAAFDKAYVDNEVAYHAAVIQVLDSTLIPSAQNAELKAMLVNVRPAFIAHLDHAKSIQSALNGGQSSAAHAGH